MKHPETFTAADVVAAANEARVEERARVEAIMSSPEGVTRPKSALKLALHSSMSVESALEFMRDLPKESMASFMSAMSVENSGIGSPFVSGSHGAGDDARERRKAELAQAARVASAANGSTSPSAAAVRKNRFA